MDQPSHRFFDHTADLGLRVAAPSFPALLEEAARALFVCVLAHPQRVQPLHACQLTLAGARGDPAYLLVDWLSELLDQFERHHQAFVRFAVTLSPDGLSAQVWGEPFDAQRHGYGHEVKAITYHQLKVQAEDGRWSAEVILDI